MTKKPRPALSDVALREAKEQVLDAFFQAGGVDDVPNNGKPDCKWCLGTGLMPFGPMHGFEIIPCACTRNDEEEKV